MTWGAINELTTLTGYQRLAAVAGHPVLAELLARIMRDESRHFLFYFHQAERRLARAARGARRPRSSSTASGRRWAAACSRPSETRFLAAYLFSGAEGRPAARRVDDRSAACPVSPTSASSRRGSIERPSITHRRPTTRRWRGRTPRHPPERSDALRLGIVGFGRLAQKYYVPALRSLSGIDSILVADPLEACRAAARAALPDVGICHAPHELMAAAPDALLVATPPSTHLQLWNDACAAGTPVLMEKPFVLHDQLGRAESSAAARRLLMVNFNRRFWPSYRRLRDLVAEGAVGRLVSADLVLHVDVLPWCAVTAHRLSPGEGGVLYDLGSQALDLVCWMLDRQPLSLTTETSTRRWEADHVLLRLGFADGVEVRCDLAYDERTSERLVITGEHGRLRLDDPNMAVRLAHHDSRERTPASRAKDLLFFAYRGLRRSHSMARYSIRASIDAFLDGVRGTRAFSPGFADAAMNAVLLDAASRSVAERATVTLDAPGRA